MRYTIQINKDQVNKAGESPLYFRFTWRLNQRRLKTGINIDPKMWDQATKQLIYVPGLATDRFRGLRLMLLERQEIFESILEGSHSLLTWDEFKTEYERQTGTHKEKPFLGVILEFRKYRYSKGLSSKAIDAVESKILDFDPGVSIEKIDFNYWVSFRDWCLAGGYRNRPVKNNTVKKDADAIRGLLEWCEIRGHKTATDWREISQKESPVDRVFLTMDELKALEAAKGLTQAEDVIRDTFLMGVYSGLRWAECVKYLNIHNIDDDYSITVIQKGGRPLVKVVEPEVIDILKRNGGKFPEVSNQNVNRVIKYVCQVAGINEIQTQASKSKEWEINKLPKSSLVNFHTARHTYTNLLWAKGMDPRNIQARLGHKRIDTTMLYSRFNTEAMKNKSGE